MGLHRSFPQRRVSFAFHIPVGYIGIVDTARDLWELTMELDKDHCHKGFGTRANILFIRSIAEITGKTQVKSVVEVDNLASQRCMKKLNAQLVNIENRAFDSEEAERFEEEHTPPQLNRCYRYANLEKPSIL